MGRMHSVECGILHIEFPSVCKLLASSEKQRYYASLLRRQYVYDHLTRFLEIQKLMDTSNEFPELSSIEDVILYCYDGPFIIQTILDESPQTKINLEDRPFWEGKEVV